MTEEAKGAYARFLKFLEKRLYEPSIRIGRQRHMLVIRDTIMGTLGAILIGSLFNVAISAPVLSEILAPYAPSFVLAYSYTFGIISMYIAALIGYNLGAYYKIDPSSTMITSLMTFLISAGLMGDGLLDITWLGTWGMFVAIVIGIFSTEVYRFCVERKIVWTIPGVPTGLSRMTEGLIPQLLSIVPIWFLREFCGVFIPRLIRDAISPLFVIGGTLPAFILVRELEVILWWMGIHAWSVLGGTWIPFLIANTLANADALAAGLPMPHFATFPFYLMVTGGVNGTFASVVWGYLSKSKKLKALGKVVIPISLFVNIYEPVFFGVPIMFNPIFFIPLVMNPIIVDTLLWTLTSMGLMRKGFIPIFFFPWSPWVPYLATGGDFMTAVWVVIVTWILPFIWWTPFARLYCKQVEAEEAREEAEESKEIEVQ